MHILWFSYVLGLNFIFLCFWVWQYIIMSLKQRKIKFEPRIKLNHNTYSLLWRAIRITSESRRMHKQPLVVTTPPTRIPHALWKWVWGTPWVLIVPNPIVSFYCTAQQKLTKYKGKYTVIMQGLKKTWITAYPLSKQLSHFAYLGPLLAHLS